MLEDILAKLALLSDEEKAQLAASTLAATQTLKWIPNPGPQTDAYFCPADELLYGGQAGGGKSALILGLALTCHERSLVMRREYTHLNSLTDEACKIYGTRDGFNASAPPRLRFKRDNLPNGGLIEFGAAQLPGSEDAWFGQPHDLLAFDEAVQFLESQVQILKTWNRSATPGQRSRMIMASNPPVRTEGQWVIKMFRPWLDLTHPAPAKSGEIRWFVRAPDGEELEVEDATPKEWNGTVYLPKSRTFIHASLQDNPFLINSGYQAGLDALEEPYRSAFRDGNFMAARKDDLDQLIPTDWIRQAQKRWRPKPPKGVPMCAIGVDVAQGGEDNTVLAIRYNGWYAPIIKVPGKQTPDGPSVAGLVLTNRKDFATVVVDMGGMVGGSTRDHLVSNGVEVVSYKGNTSTTRKTRKEQQGFKNTRVQAYWQFREALDPDQPGGSPICLPDDPELLADLTCLHFDVDTKGVFLKEKKDQIRSILNRSPDKGDAVVMAWYAGAKNLGGPEDWARHQSVNFGKGRPKVLMKTRGSKRK